MKRANNDRRGAIPVLTLLLAAALAACGGGGSGDGSGPLPGGSEPMLSFCPPGDPAEVISPGGFPLLGNRLLVRLVAGTGRPAADALALALGGAVVGEVSPLNLFVLEFSPAPSGMDELDALASALEADAAVTTVTYDLLLSDRDVAQSDIQDGYAALLHGRAQVWAYDRVQGQAAWNLLATRVNDGLLALTEVRVAAVDSGLDAAHTEFTGVDLSNSADYTGAGDTGDNLGGHGTAVTSIIGARTGDGGMNGLLAPVPGLAYNLQIHKARGVAAAGSVLFGLDTFLAALQGALNLPAATRPRVINMSWGADLPDVWNTAARTQRLRNAFVTFRTLFQNHDGVLFVMAAANAPYDGGDDALVETDWTGGTAALDLVDLPGSIDEPNALTVAGLEPGDDRASFSSYGAHVDLAAPAIDIYAARPGQLYALKAGNSFAAPFVTAAAGLLLAVSPDLNPAGNALFPGAREYLRDGAMPLQVATPNGTENWRSLKVFDSLRLLVADGGAGEILGYAALAYNALPDALSDYQLRASQLRRQADGSSTGFRTLVEGTGTGRTAALSWDGRHVAWTRSDGDLHRVDMLAHASAPLVVTPPDGEFDVAYAASGNLWFLRAVQTGESSYEQRVIERTDAGENEILSVTIDIPPGGFQDVHGLRMTADAFYPFDARFLFQHHAYHYDPATETTLTIEPTVLFHPVDTPGEPPVQEGGTADRVEASCARFLVSSLAADPLVQDAYVVWRERQAAYPAPGTTPLRAALLRYDLASGDVTILNERVLHDSADSHATWSPDGSEIFFVSGTRILSIRTRKITELVRPDLEPLGFDGEASEVLVVVDPAPEAPVPPVLSPTASWSVQR